LTSENDESLLEHQVNINVVLTPKAQTKRKKESHEKLPVLIPQKQQAKEHSERQEEGAKLLEFTTESLIEKSSCYKSNIHKDNKKYKRIIIYESKPEIDTEECKIDTRQIYIKL
jgi:hypothetical protein